jgi:hypothetical protein
VLKTVAGWVWLAGVCGMLLYALISFLRLRHRVRASVLLEKGVYVCDEISDPFILGLIVPKIYLPSGMDEQTRAYVLAHERAHLKRFDYIWKPLGFLLLSIYWFNPLLWLAYLLLCRDIELACDEKVVKELDDAGKAAYSEALVHASVTRRMVSACPLAFGETGVKGRVKSVLNYKKPAFWIILVAILACVAVAVCFLTMPKKKDKPNEDAALPTAVPETVWGSDAKVLQWLDYFYSSDMPWNDQKEITLDAYPGVTFRWTAGSVEAIENGRTRTLFSGMPVWNVFFADMTGDGKPELCASVYFGSGIVDEHIVVYDYVNKQSYVLWDRMQFDYHLYTADGKLFVGKTPYMGDKQIDYGTIVRQGAALFCRFQSDGSMIPLMKELHESELVGEWLVEEERDANDNMIYTRSLDLWKEYNFRNDGTVTYTETVPYSSDYELAFGHPVSYPYAVYDGTVQIGTREDGNYYGYGYLDETGKLQLTVEVGTNEFVYATLRRMGANAAEDDELDALRRSYPEYFDLPADKGLEVYVWQMAPNDYSFGVMAGTNLRKEDELLWNLRGVSAEQMRLILSTYDIAPENIEVIPFINPISSYAYEINDAYTAFVRKMLFTDAPQAEAAAELTQEQAEAFLNELSVEIEDGSPYGCDLVVFIDGFGTCLNVGDPNAFERASLRYELLSRNNQNGSIDYAKILSVGELPYYIGDITVFAYGDQLVYGEEWNDEYPFADASILVPVNPLMMDRNQSCPERCCVIRSFDPVNRTVTVSFGLQEEMSSDAPGEYVDYASIETEQITLQVTDETFLTLIGDDYDTLVKPDRFFRFFEEYEFIDLYLFDENNEDASIGFWIGVDGDTLLYLCEMMEV